MDEDGNRWMHTGDEATIDSEGYCRITGRIKDIIIPGLIPINYQLQILMSAPGGENISRSRLRRGWLSIPLLFKRA